MLTRSPAADVIVDLSGHRRRLRRQLLELVATAIAVGTVAGLAAGYLVWG